MSLLINPLILNRCVILLFNCIVTSPMIIVSLQIILIVNHWIFFEKAVKRRPASKFQSETKICTFAISFLLLEVPEDLNRKIKGSQVAMPISCGYIATSFIPRVLPP